MREIKEPDWKVLRRVHPLALERFCERVLAEIDRVSRDGATSHHARYLQIFRILQQRDREMARLFDNPRRSHALTMLAQMVATPRLGPLSQQLGHTSRNLSHPRQHRLGSIFCAWGW
jgi:hypothetical protein